MTENLTSTHDPRVCKFCGRACTIERLKELESLNLDVVVCDSCAVKSPYLRIALRQAESEDTNPPIQRKFRWMSKDRIHPAVLPILLVVLIGGAFGTAMLLHLRSKLPPISPFEQILTTRNDVVLLRTQDDAVHHLVHQFGRPPRFDRNVGIVRADDWCIGRRGQLWALSNSTTQGDQRSSVSASADNGRSWMSIALGASAIQPVAFLPSINSSSDVAVLAGDGRMWAFSANYRVEEIRFVAIGTPVPALKLENAFSGEGRIVASGSGECWLSVDWGTSWKLIGEQGFLCGTFVAGEFWGITSAGELWRIPKDTHNGKLYSKGILPIGLGVTRGALVIAREGNRAPVLRVDVRTGAFEEVEAIQGPVSLISGHQDVYVLTDRLWRVSLFHCSAIHDLPPVEGR